MDPTLDTLKTAIDTVWVLFATCLIFWMCAGFAMIEVGFARVKHATHVLAMNYAVVAVVGLGFWFTGFALMFGDGNGFVGMQGFLPNLLNTGGFTVLAGSSLPLATKFLFQMVFADTTATIVSGTVAERMKFGAYMLFAVLTVCLIYPVAGHWVWGGGWLSQLAVPFQDFAGSTVVHTIGGVCALTGTIFVGPRIGRFLADGTVVPMRAHNLSLAVLGALILWLGWFGFNAGSTLAADPRAIAHVMATTMLAGCAGLASSMAVSWIKHKPDLGVICNGTLAGLVAVTAGCNAVSMAGAFWIGAIAGVLCYFAGPLFEKLKIDDPVGALPVHLVNGIWGTLAVGLFATKAGSVGSFDGLLYGGGGALLVTQAVGSASVVAFVAVASSLCWLLVKMTVGLRVPASVEMDGLDMHEHGSFAYDFNLDDDAEAAHRTTIVSATVQEVAGMRTR